jgi:hypothetical protein
MTLVLQLVFSLLALPSPASAFHHHGQFQEHADGRSEVPGSGMLYYTGSRRDLGLRCSSCHVEAPGRIRAEVVFSPELSDGRYAPGRRYDVTVRMNGESRGIAECMPPMVNRNAMVAMLVGPDGFPAGTISPDRGGRQCGNRYPAYAAPQTTVVFGDCDAVVGGQDDRALTTWRFSFDAPSTGAGEATLWIGMVDGDCMFDSYRDDVYETAVRMPEGSMARSFERAPRGVRTRELFACREAVFGLPPRRRTLGGWA